MAKKKRNPVATHMPQPVAKFILRCRHIVLAMTGSSWFPSPPVALTTVTTDIDALEAAEARARRGGDGTVADRDEKRQIVDDHVAGLKAYVQSVVHQNPDQAALITQSAGLYTRRVTRRHKAPLDVVKGVLEGEALIQAKAVGKSAAYEWQHSLDGGKSWLSLPTTTVADTRVSGLVLGTLYLFRFRTIRGRKAGEWSQSVAYYAH
jgi:hypothetical protein